MGARGRRLLLAKPHQLSISRAGVGAVLPSAGGSQGDLIDEANLDAEAELQIRVRQTDVRLQRAIEESLTRIGRGTFGVCENCEGLEPAWKSFPGRASALIARSESTLKRPGKDSCRIRYCVGSGGAEYSANQLHIHPVLVAPNHCSAVSNCTAPD